jgi:hypothetical protein
MNAKNALPKEFPQECGPTLCTFLNIAHVYFYSILPLHQFDDEWEFKWIFAHFVELNV